MPEPHPNDNGADVPPGDTDQATPEEAPAEDTAPAVRKTPAELQAEVEARRAATSARMDGVEAPARATSDDPTGRKARKAMGKATSDDPTGRAGRSAKAPSVPKPSKRTGGLDTKSARAAAARSGNPKRAAEAAEASRYTAPIPRSQIESPAWVGALMFILLGLGMVVIFLTYVAWGGRPLTLGIGLGFILGGILTATQLR